MLPTVPPTAGVLILLIVAQAQGARPDLVLMGALGLLLADGAVGLLAIRLRAS